MHELLNDQNKVIYSLGITDEISVEWIAKPFNHH